MRYSVHEVTPDRIGGFPFTGPPITVPFVIKRYRERQRFNICWRCLVPLESSFIFQFLQRVVVGLQPLGSFRVSTGTEYGQRWWCAGVDLFWCGAQPLGEFFKDHTMRFGGVPFWTYCVKVDYLYLHLRAILHLCHNVFQFIYTNVSCGPCAVFKFYFIRVVRYIS